MFPLPFKDTINTLQKQTRIKTLLHLVLPTQCLLTLTCLPHGVWFLCLISWLLNNLRITGWIPPPKLTHAVTLSLSHPLQTTNKLPSWLCFLFFGLMVASLWRHNVKQRVPEPMALSINNARSMSLLSFLFFFPKGMGWIQSSDTPAGPIQLISHTSCLSSSRSIREYFTHCPATVCLSPIVTFSFLFWFCDLCPFRPWNPHPLFFLFLYLTLSIFPVSFHVFLHKHSFRSIPSLILFYSIQIHIHILYASICLSLLITIFSHF